MKETDYIGELVFEGNNLQFLQHSEGRAIPDGAGREYQYHLKDHLGNVRVTFTTKPQTPVSYFGNLETGTANSGENVFGNYTSTTYDLVDHTDEAGTTYQKVQWLNGGASGRIGLTKSLPVMPGDRVSVQAYAKYMNLSTNANPNAFATALASAFGVSSGSTGEQLKLYNGLNTYAAEVPGGDHYGDDDLAPKAFVTIILFDRNFNFLSAGWDQITTDGEQVSGTVKEPPHDELFQEVTVQEPGYAYIFISNEHPYYVDMYFDDVTVTQTTSPIVSSSDYFPFGLAYNVGEKQGATEQRQLFQGKEIQDELGLNTYDFFWRAYDPAVARTTTQDPHSYNYWDQSPYSFLANNPINFLDPTGMDTTKAANLDMHTFKPETDVVVLDEVVVTPGDNPDTGETANGPVSPGQDFTADTKEAGAQYGPTTDHMFKGISPPEANNGGGSLWISSGQNALEILAGLSGAAQRLLVNGDRWAGRNGKYYSKDWWGNQYTGTRSGAYKAAAGYRTVGRVAVAATVVIGGIAIYNGYQADGGQVGYNTQYAAASTAGGLLGGWAGAEGGAAVGAAIGVWFGGVGAIPGAVIGGMIGGIGGSLLGSSIGESSVDYYHGR